MIHHIKKAVRLVRTEGFSGLGRRGLSRFLHGYGQRIPVASLRRRAGLWTEVDFWDGYFRTKGLEWPETYPMRLDPNLPLQARPAALLPADAEEVQILDVGAGPLSYLGKKHGQLRLVLTAVDPLADEYAKVLKKYQVKAPVRTQKLAAEALTQRFANNSFDLVFARNCIDHAASPEKAILEMISVAKPGRYVLLEHAPNEAEKEHYAGLHQWNFSMSADGDFIVRSKAGETNMTRKYADRCQITCELGQEDGVGDWLIVRMLKK